MEISMDSTEYYGVMNILKNHLQNETNLAATIANSDKYFYDNYELR